MELTQEQLKVQITGIVFDFSPEDETLEGYTLTEREEYKARVTNEWSNKVISIDWDEEEDDEDDLHRSVLDAVSDESGWLIEDIRYAD